MKYEQLYHEFHDGKHPIPIIPNHRQYYKILRKMREVLEPNEEQIKVLRAREVVTPKTDKKGTRNGSTSFLFT